jgi:bifunctional DNase/RNase
MVEMNLVGVRVELPTNNPIVLLREADGEHRVLPIFIGAVEATAIAFALQGVVTQRPMTHDLMRDLLQTLAVQVERVVVTELKEGTFYAELTLTQAGGGTVTVSSRPSDAIALAARLGTPIFADEAVLEEAAIEVSEEDEQEEEVEKFRAFLQDVNPEDFAS